MTPYNDLTYKPLQKATICFKMLVFLISRTGFKDMYSVVTCCVSGDWKSYEIQHRYRCV